MTDVMTICRTAQLLISLPKVVDLTFDYEDLILYRTRSFTKKTQVYLTDLVYRAQRAAFGSYTANVLVGASNEGSETGDVGLWLGDGEYGKGNEENILKTLGLPESCLTTLKSRAEPELMKELKLEETTMKGRYCFSVDLEGRSSTAYVFFFYIGEFEDGWGGLVAAGVWT